MDTSAIIAVVLDIFIGTDERNWPQVEQAFASQVVLDYTSMTGGKPATLAPAEIMASWQGVLPGFQSTHHQLGNFVVTEKGSEADVFCYGTATHYLPNESGQNVWTVVGTYNFHLTSIDGAWKVNVMKFNLKYQDGNLTLPQLATEQLKK